MNCRRTIGWQGMCLAVLAIVLITFGCGESDGRASSSGGSSKKATPGSDRHGALKETQWGISRVGKRRVRIGAFVPYCGEPHPQPYIERVNRHRAPGRVVLTMFVRYPPVKGACFGKDVSVRHWVAVGSDPRKLAFYDGATSPPEKRPVP